MYDELVKRLRCQLYGNCPACVNWYTEEVEPNLWRERCVAIDAADAIEELSKPKWIPVSERLPERDKDALIYASWIGASGTVYKEIILATLSEIEYQGYKPIAWMPLPQPPKAEEGE